MAALTFLAMGLWQTVCGGSQSTESLKWLQFMQTTATFLLPPILCAWLWDSGHKPFTWLKMDKKVSWQDAVLAVGIMICAIPCINLLADLNSHVQLPDSLASIEQQLKQMEEAKLRDHNKLGRELEYFTTVDIIGQGLPILLPKGARTIQVLQRWVEDLEQSKGYQLTKTPYFAKRELYKLSGHWDHYRDGMFIMGDPDDETKDCFAMRPMTCPFQYQVFLNRKRSYRDLPFRISHIFPSLAKIS